MIDWHICEFDDENKIKFKSIIVYNKVYVLLKWWIEIELSLNGVFVHNIFRNFEVLHTISMA